MNTGRKTIGDKTYFIVSDVDPAYHDALLALAYNPVDDGYGRPYRSDDPHLEQTYLNFKQYIEPLILQRAGVQSTPWDQGLEAFIGRVEKREINWWLLGSTALAIRGLAVSPGDIDLGTDDAGVHQIAGLLLDFMVGPLEDARGWVVNWFGRAFLHVCIDITGGVVAAADQPNINDFGPEAVRRLETVQWRDHLLRVPPLDLQLAVNERRGRHERAALIRQVLEREQ